FPVEQIRKVRETSSVTALEKETQHFVGITSINGLLRVYRSKGWIRIFWITVMILCVIILLWTSMNILVRYLSKPTTSQVSFIVSPKGLQFPKLTICNFNAIRKSYIQALNKTGDFSVSVLQYLLQSTSDVQLLYATTSESILTKDEDALLKYIGNHSDFSIKKFNCKDMLKQCTFAGRTFDCCRYSKSVLTSFGRCQVLNLRDSNIEWMRKQKEEGADGGLQIVLDAHLEEQVDVFSEAEAVFTKQYENGFWYYVDEPTSDTYRGAEGISVSPGDRVYSSMQAYHYTLLDKHNWGNCTSAFPEEYDVKLKSKYSSKDCTSICKARFFYSKCKCVPFVNNIEGVHRSCTPLESYQCFKQHIVKNINETTEDFAWPECLECAMECERWEYSAMNAYGRGISPGAVTWLRAKNTSITREHIEKNFVTMSVYYRGMVYTEHRQQQDRTIVETLSDMGGVMGLFLGLNLLTVVEMVIYSWKVFWIFLSRNRRLYLTEKKDREEREEQEKQDAVNYVRRLSTDLLGDMDPPRKKMSIGVRLKLAVQRKNGKVAPAGSRNRLKRTSISSVSGQLPARYKSPREKFLDRFYEQRLHGNGMANLSGYSSAATSRRTSMVGIREEDEEVK
ncbi:hypothetical protein PENTCL1PPCAC_24477, partial [Pristionchus entomophagus]